MKKNNFSLIAGFLFILLLFSLSISTQMSSPERQFNVTEHTIYLNWTNNYRFNITIGINSTSFNNITVEILNTSSGVSSNYSHANSGRTRCQLAAADTGYRLFVMNVSGDYNNIIGPIDSGLTKSVVIADNIDYNHLSCIPGRYRIERFTLRNQTNTNETLNITVLVEIPISFANNYNIASTGIETFGDSGTRLLENTTTYHSYYLNTSVVPNATGIMINLTGWSSSQDVDLFLFDNSSTPMLKAKSINKTSTSESLLYNFLPTTEKIWEIRIYGNSTSAIYYNGTVVFTTLNANKSSDILMASLNFGVLNATTTNQKIYNLTNEGNLTLSNVVETKELYHIERFNGNSTKNSTFYVSYPVVKKIKAVLNWTGASNYTLNVFNQDDSLVANSTNKYVYANKTGAMQEEYAETSNISSGIWKVGVINNTNVTYNPYNVTVYLYTDSADWIRTNYTTMIFNRTGNDNYTVDIQINLTIPNTTMNGLYEGYLQYLDVNSAGLRIPISFNVTTPMLIVNNTFNFTTITVNENYGINLNRNIYVNVNNSGPYNLFIELTNSSGELHCVSGTGCNTSYIATLTFNQTNPIGAYSSKVMNITISFNSSMPRGLYEGWILFNTANSTTGNLSSHPTETFNLTLRLNLTDVIDIRIFDIISFGDDAVINGSITENARLKFKLYYVNGTELGTNSLNTSNFTIWLTNMNISSYRIPWSGGLNLANGTDPIYTGNYYYVNFTVSANKPGGYYIMNIMANYTENSLFGYNANQTIMISSTGLLMSTNSTGCSFGTSLGYNPTPSVVNNTTTNYIYVNISNYGPLAASCTNITFNESCRYSVSYLGYTGCVLCDHADATSSGISWITISPAAYSSSCLVWWKITPGMAESYPQCTYGNIWADSSNQWFNPNGINVTMTVTAAATTTTTTTATTVSSNEGTSGTTGTTNRTATALLYLDITSYPSTVSIEQGGNKTETIKVKNINKTITQNVKLEIFGIEDSSWYSIVPSTYVPITNQSEYTFFVAFNIPKSTAVNDYPALFKASSSYNYTKKNFVLEVTPGEETKTQITLNISNYKTQILSLEKELNQSKSKGVNVSEAESLFSQLKQKITSVDAYIALGDFDSAYDLLDDIEILINQTKSAMKVGSKLNIGKILNWQSLLKWGVVGGAVAGIAFFGYLFWPTPLEYKPETSLKTSKTGFGIKYKIVEILRKIKEKLTFKKRNEQALSYKK